MVKTFLAGALMALALTAQAEHDQPRTPRSALGASVATDGTATWVAYREGEHVMLRQSRDGGTTWGEPRKVNSVAESIEASGDSYPKVALGRTGEVFVTWTRPLGKFHTGEIRFARSPDGGKSFADPVTVHVDRQQITHRFDAIAVTPQGKLFVAWIDSRDGRSGLYFTLSEDNGKTFRTERAAASGACECCRIALIARPDGGAVAMWRHVFDSNIRDHAVVSLGANGQAGAMRRATFDDWHLDGCPHHGPSLAEDAAGQLHAVWFSGTPGKEGVYYGRIRDGAVDGQRRVGGDSAGHADLAVSGRRVAIAWKEQEGGATRLRAMLSEDAGNSWRTVDLASTGEASDHPKVFAYRDGFRVLWNTREQPLKVVALLP